MRLGAAGPSVTGPGVTGPGVAGPDVTGPDVAAPVVADPVLVVPGPGGRSCGPLGAGAVLRAPPEGAPRGLLMDRAARAL